MSKKIHYLPLLLLYILGIPLLLSSCNNDEPKANESSNPPSNPDENYKDFSDLYGYWINSDKSGAMNFVKHSSYQCKVLYYVYTTAFQKGYAEWESLYGGNTFSVLGPYNEGISGCLAIDVKISSNSPNKIVLKNSGNGEALSSYIFSRVTEEEFFNYLYYGW